MFGCVIKQIRDIFASHMCRGIYVYERVEKYSISDTLNFFFLIYVSYYHNGGLLS